SPPLGRTPISPHLRQEREFEEDARDRSRSPRACVGFRAYSLARKRRMPEVRARGGAHTPLFQIGLADTASLETRYRSESQSNLHQPTLGERPGHRETVEQRGEIR